MRVDLLASLMLSRSERLNFSETESNKWGNNMCSIIIPPHYESQDIFNLLSKIPDNLEVTTKIEEVVARNYRSGGKSQ
jgi:hypothetical protein